MREILLDANVLVSFLTDRDPRQQELASSLFEQASRGEHTLVLHQVALTETVYVLLNVYQVSSKDVAQILEELLEMPGARPENELSWPTVFDLWPDSVADFGDAALATVARQGRYEVATFDSKFARKLAQQKIPTRW